jgi:hypothetical protein
MFKIARGDFVQVLAGLSVAAFCGCGGSSPPEIDAAPPNCSVGNAAVTIGASPDFADSADNHAHAPHELVVTGADIAAGVEKTYDIMGQASHTHMVTVTAADFVTLQGGGTVEEASTMTFCHFHVATISCAAP